MRKTLISIIILLGLTSFVYSQSTDQNYIRTRTYTVRGGLNNGYLDQIQYFDGLGRPIQTVQVGITPAKKDLTSIQEYDAFGRESNTWLPGYGTGNGVYTAPSTVQASAKTLNARDQNPFSKPVYEASPLNRVIEQYGSGQNWHNNGKSVRTFYLTNKGSSQIVEKNQTFEDEKLLSGSYGSCETISLKPGFYFKSASDKSLHLYIDPYHCQQAKVMPRSAAMAKSAVMPTLRDEFLKCTYYEVASASLTKNGEYKAGELYVTLMLDENDNQSLEFKDKLGQVVLTRQINGSEKYDTYYVYDDFGNLRYVLPPMAIDKVTKYTDTDPVMKQYAYIYRYDNRNRCIWKQLPGAEPIYYVYDKADRLIFTQDGEQRNGKNEWTFSIPDAFGRVVLTGICTNTLDYTKNPLEFVVVKATLPEAVNGTYKGYNVTGVPLSSTATLLSVNYYDNYDFLGKYGITNGAYTAETGYGVCYGDHQAANKHKNKGLLTGTLTAQYKPDGTIDTKYLYSVMYYDNRGRVIQTKSNNHLDGGLEATYTAYDFVGNLTQMKSVHSATGKSTQTEVYTYAYDHAGRLQTTKHSLNGAAAVLIAENKYDELGRLQTNKKGNQENLKTTYAYNVRSWTTSMKNYNLHFNLDYNHNGNIKTQKWRQAGQDRTYTFAYDNLSRLTKADFTGATNEKYNTNYSYDKHGNMMTLQRYGKLDVAKNVTDFGLVDNLTMAYAGNQLTKVDDTAKEIILTGSEDFKNGTNQAIEYTYNKNGAMVKDLNKGISNIRYNSLNLPMSIAIDGKGSIEYLYSATGQKLQTQHKTATTTYQSPLTFSATTQADKVTDYVGNKVYENQQLKRILIDGGYIEDGKYFYYLTDHLGNNRMVSNSSAGIIQQTQYYPFGSAFAPSGADALQPYKYNGKELDKMHGLNMYDYSARHYDAAIGRFTTIDPSAEYYHSISPYVYVANNPILNIDPDGRDYWSTNDPELIKRFFNSMGSGASTHDMSGWNHATDAEFVGKGTLNDETGKFYTSYTTTENGVTTVVGVSFDTNIKPGLTSGGFGYPGAFAYKYENAAFFRKAYYHLYDVTDFSDVIGPVDPKRFFDGRTSWTVDASGRIGGINNVLEARSPKIRGKGIVTALNQLNKLVKTGRAPSTIKRFDKGKITGEKDHVHFSDGSALNVDGTWKHGSRVLTNQEIKFLQNNGFQMPK